MASKEELKMTVEAVAPCRIDLAGGTLDIYPLYLFEEGGITVNIMTTDAESFRRSRTQVASDIARAVAFGRRGM